MKKIAVIGAGLTGAAAASTLVRHGYQVSVFDKGRGAGGRMTSKRTEQGYLDLGAQYFTARSDSFKRQVQQWLQQGQVQQWHCNTALFCHDDEVLSLKASHDQQARYIGVPAMHSPVKALLAGVDVHNSCRIQQLHYNTKRWTLLTEAGLQHPEFDAVLLTIPPAQLQQLLLQSGLVQCQASIATLLEPCWAVAVEAEPLAIADAIFCQHPKLRFISHQMQKTARHRCYVLHFSAAFSTEHLEQSTEFWFEQAAALLRNELGVHGKITPLVAHRWLYASQADQAPVPGLLSRPEQQLWIGADWSFGGRVENAYLAGLALARSVIEAGQQQLENV